MTPAACICSVGTIRQDGPSSKTTDIIDRIRVMLTQEETTYAVKDYKSHLPSTPQENGEDASEPIDDVCRLKMVEWLYAIVDMCRISRHSVVLAYSYVDRLLSNSTSDTAKRALGDRQFYQLLVMTCLYMACKVSEPRVIGLNVLSQLSRGKYSEDDFEEMEMNILKDIGWRLSGPTASDFAHFFLALGNHSMDKSTEETLAILSCMQTELSIADHFFLSTPPSTVALASIRNAMEEIGQDHNSMQDRNDILMKIADCADVNPFSKQVEQARAYLKKMVAKSSKGQELQVLSSEFLCRAAPPRPKLQQASSPVSVSRLSVSNLEALEEEKDQ